NDKFVIMFVRAACKVVLNAQLVTGCFSCNNSTRETVFETLQAIQTSTECSREQCLFERKREREEKRTIIDYANDQLDERSSDSSSAANAIVVWQFAVVQVHLTRFKNREKKGHTMWFCESHTSAGLPRVEFRPLLPSLHSSTSSCLFRIWTNYADGGVRGDFDSPRWLARSDMSDFTWGIPRELEKLMRPDLVECQLFRRELVIEISDSSQFFPQPAESKQYISHEYILLTDRNDTSGRSFNRCESLEAFLISEVFQVLGGYWIPKSNICRKITMNHQPQQLSHKISLTVSSDLRAFCGVNSRIYICGAGSVAEERRPEKRTCKLKLQLQKALLFKVRLCSVGLYYGEMGFVVAFVTRSTGELWKTYYGLDPMVYILGGCEPRVLKLQHGVQ
ncbi:hypothetical protein ALC53_11322, partial [Atta colombica]